MASLGIIGGTSVFKSSIFQSLQPVTVDTPHGAVELLSGDKFAFVQRHHAEVGGEYRQPHLINKRSLVAALKKHGVSAVVGVFSVGTLKPDTIPVGSVVIADDFFCPSDPISMVQDYSAHVVPTFNQELRDKVVSALSAAGCNPVTSGTYAQTFGPRFETKSEIRFLAQHADLVGMTGAHEAVLCQELGLPFIMVCFVDNLCNGIQDSGLSVEKFKQGVSENQPMVDKVIRVVLEAALPGCISASIEKCEVVDTIVHAKWIVPVEPKNVVLEDHAVVVNKGVILDILPSASVSHKYIGSAVHRLKDHVLAPGLVNAHTHASMTLMRGKCDDKPLMEWLTTEIWPIEGALVAPDFVVAGLRLGMAEMVRGGTTCFNDMYFFSDSLAKAVDEFGMRAVLGLVVLDFPSAYAKGGDEYFAKGLEVAKKGSDLVSFAWAPHAPYTCGDDNLMRIKELADEMNTPIHIHLHETADECNHSEAGAESPAAHRSPHAMRPAANLKRMGLMTQRLVAAHMTHCTDDEVAMFAEAKANVVHCPTSNLKLASGFCPVAKLAAGGVNVAIGTDGASSNNSLDMMAEMKTAAVLAKAVASDATAVDAATALQMATLNGARALGLGDKTGSLVKGKQADMMAVKLEDVWATTPVYNAISTLVYAANRDSVSDVWISGKHLLQSGKLVTVDVADLKAAVAFHKAKVLEVCPMKTA